MEGLKRVVNDAKHRKEVVAGGLTQYLMAGTLVPLNHETLPTCAGRIS